MTTAGGAALPKYLRVAAVIRRQIADGTLRPGQPAPSGAELSRAFGFSTLTCRKALRALIADGLLVPGPSPNARPRVADPQAPDPERDLADAARALSAGLAARRHAAGLTQAELAALAGVSVTTVGHAETGPNLAVAPLLGARRRRPARGRRPAPPARRLPRRQLPPARPKIKNRLDRTDREPHPHRPRARHPAGSASAPLPPRPAQAVTADTASVQTGSAQTDLAEAGQPAPLVPSRRSGDGNGRRRPVPGRTVTGRPVPDRHRLDRRHHHHRPRARSPRGPARADHFPDLER